MKQLVSALRSGLRILREDGVRRTAREGSFFAYEHALRTMHSASGRADTGENMYDREWEVLVVLDACRVDLMNEVCLDRTYDFLPATKVPTFRSPGSMSAEWMERTFTPSYADEMANTIHITANPFSESRLEAKWFHSLDEVWQYAWDDDEETTLPRPLTDRAIAAWRDRDPEVNRMIVHYMQPHVPFVGYDFQSGPDPNSWGYSDTGTTAWTRLRDGDLDYDEVWSAYRDNLCTVLDDVELLLANLDSDRVVLTADHGNAVGECGLYGHPRGIAIDALREVPWVETTGADSGEYEPSLDREHDRVARTKEEGVIEDRLESLGYV